MEDYMQEETAVRVAVVTGGSRGIGRAICRRLALDGMKVCFSYINNKAAAEETMKGFPDMMAVQADVSTEEGCKAVMDAAAAAFGQIDVLVNNAGITRDGLAMGMKTEAFDAVIATNLRGTFVASRLVLRGMIRNRYGRIINMSSVVGIHGNAGQANYAASKAGVIGLTKSMAKELASRGITVNAVAPGFIATDMTEAMTETAKQATLMAIPAGHMGRPEDIAEAVAFLASEKAGYITGQVLGVDGGMGM